MNNNEYRNRLSSRGYSPEDPLPLKKKLSSEKILLIGLFVFILGSLGYNYLSNKIADKTEETTEVSLSTEKKMNKESNTGYSSKTAISDSSISTTEKEEKTSSVRDEDDNGLSTIDILEKRTHESIEEQARRMGVSAQGSTSDILERIAHQSVIEQAKQAGVSTEGSTTDILERMTHQSVVEQAKQAGVSTKGSTTDILERMTHQSVVEQAKQAGVSTEGSTTDILERITRKSLEEFGY